MSEVKVMMGRRHIIVPDHGGVHAISASPLCVPSYTPRSDDPIRLASQGETYFDSLGRPASVPISNVVITAEHVHCAQFKKSRPIVYMPIVATLHRIGRAR